MQDGWADETLWRGLQARDARALEALIGRYAREVAYFIRVVLDGVGTAQDAEECVNDLFVAVWQEIASYEPQRANFRTWLTMRAKYIALDRRRQIQRRLARTAFVVAGGAGRDGEPLAASDARSIPEAATTADSLEGLLERRERQEQLRNALEGLPELDRLLVYLRYFRVATSDEIATRTGLTRRAIDTRLWRVRKTLRAMLEALEERAHEHVRAR